MKLSAGPNFNRYLCRASFPSPRANFDPNDNTHTELTNFRHDDIESSGGAKQ